MLLEAYEFLGKPYGLELACLLSYLYYINFPLIGVFLPVSFGSVSSPSG